MAFLKKHGFTILKIVVGAAATPVLVYLVQQGIISPTMASAIGIGTGAGFTAAKGIK